MTEPSAPQPFQPQVPNAYPGTPQPPLPPQAKKKRWFTRWWVWLLALIVIVPTLGALGSGGGGSRNAPDSVSLADSSVAPGAEKKDAAAEAQEPAPPKEPLTLDKGWKVDKSGYSVQVKGFVSNNTDRAITTYVSIQFDVLDKDGNNLDSCIDSTSTIDAKGKWKFEATCFDDKKDIAKVRFKELSGF